MKRFKMQFQSLEDITPDSEHLHVDSIVVDGQALTGAELYRRMSAGLPVGCAVRSFNEINPQLEKFSVYDALGSFRMRHGLVDNSELTPPETPPETPVQETEPSQK